MWKAASNFNRKLYFIQFKPPPIPSILTQFKPNQDYSETLDNL